MGAVSLRYALEYIASLAPTAKLADGITAIHAHEQYLTLYALEQFAKFGDKLELI